MVLYSLTKFSIIKSWTNTPWLRRFDLGFWQTSKQIYRKLQYTQKVFREFQDLPRFPRKMILYPSTKFGIRKVWTNTPWVRRFDLGFSHTSKEIYGKLQYTEKGFGKFQRFPRFPRKNRFVFVKLILHFRAFYQRSIAQKIRFRLLADFRTSL